MVCPFVLQAPEEPFGHRVVVTVNRSVVAGGDHPGVGLESSLGGDHLDELLGQIDIRHFNGLGIDGSQGSVLGTSGQGLPGSS